MIDPRHLEPGTGEQNVAPGFNPGLADTFTPGAAGREGVSPRGPGGDINSELETRNPEPENELILDLPRRTDRSYEIEAVTKARLILETLVEEQPITEKDLVRKTQFSKDIVFRTLRTYAIGGWAMRNDATLEWRVGPRLARLAVDIRS